MIDSIPELNPIAGILSIPLAGLGYRQNFRMRPREILSRNLKALMAAKPGLETIKKIVAATDGRLSNGKLDRIRRADATTDIDTLYEIATTFELQPWQLLVENLDPLDLPTLNDAKVLSQILQSFVTSQQAHSSVRTTSPDKPLPVPAEVPSRIRKTGSQKYGPALSKAFKAGEGVGDANSQPGGLSKPRGKSLNKGTGRSK